MPRVEAVGPQSDPAVPGGELGPPLRVARDQTAIERGMGRPHGIEPREEVPTHVIFEPLDFIARLAALVPRPRVNLTRFHGVFAPNSQHRALVTPAKRGKGSQAKGSDAPQTSTERRASMSWAQRLKRVFNIDIETCQACGGPVRIIACIEDPEVIEKILTHLDQKITAQAAGLLPEGRAPPLSRFN